MKKTLLQLSLLALPLIGSAQITFTQSDLPTAGTMWFELTDTTTHQVITPGGANQTWNYSNFTVAMSAATHFQNTAAAPAGWSSNFPSSQMLTYSAADTTATYYSSNSTGFYTDGIYDGGLNPQPGNVLAFNPNYLLIPTPFTYGNTRNSTAKITFTVNQGFNIKLVSYTYQLFTADGYGSITTPAGMFSNTLRIKRMAYSLDTTYADFGAGYQMVSSSPPKDTAMTYMWLKNGANDALVFQINEKMNGPIGTGLAESASYYNNTATHIPTFLKPTASIAYPNPSNGSKSLTISLDGKNAENLVIYNTLGELVKTESVSGSNVVLFDTNLFESGIYIYKITGKDSREISSGKFTITK
ncbi:MAG: T9SS type A sorting domain-containing protein [Bacteroidota bacterium]